MSKLDDLKNEIAVLEAATEQSAPVQTTDPEPQATIADDDPELLAFMEAENAKLAQCRKDIGNLEGLKPLTLAEAKGLFLYYRLRAKLYAIASDESKPMPERVAAVKEMRTNKAWPTHATTYAVPELAGLKDAEVVERLTAHPHQARLRELYEIIHDPAQRTSLQPWEERIAAVKEFRRLREEYPRRYVGFCVLPDAEQTIAFWYSHNDPEHGKTRDMYRMILERAGVIA